MTELLEQLEGCARRADPWGSLAKDIKKHKRTDRYIEERDKLSDEDQKLVMRLVFEVKQ